MDTLPGRIWPLIEFGATHPAPAIVVAAVGVIVVAVFEHRRKP
jgi:hypothetical protein